MSSSQSSYQLTGKGGDGRKSPQLQRSNTDGDKIAAHFQGACRLDSPQLSAASSVESVLVQVDLEKSLTPEAKDAFVSFVLLILQLDFPDVPNCSNKEFRQTAAKIVMKAMKLSEKAGKTRVLEMEAGMASGEMTDQIVCLKTDPFVASNGTIVVVAELVGIFVRTGIYDSRYRVLLRHIAAMLSLRWETVEQVEQKVAHLLTQDQYEESEPDDELEASKARASKDKNRKWKRWGAIGVAGAVGGTLIGLTGGLAAPLVAAGAGVVLGGGVAAGIATTAGAAVLGSLFGVAGAGLTGYKMQKRVGAVEEFVVETLSEGQSLHVAICVSGWIEEERDDAFRWAWRHLDASKEQYCLRYESTYLLQLGKAMDYFMSIALTYAVQQTLMETAFATLVSAIAWPMAVISIASVVDNPWNICIRRAQEVGQHLADILLSRQQGQRPVTLLGFSLGARVIFHCLLEMSKRPNHQGIVEDVVLLGAPITGSKGEWKRIATVVGGRIINGYSNKDVLLKFLYRTMNAQLSIAGIGPVTGTGERKIQNVDLSHLIDGHLQYRHRLREILETVGVRVRPHDTPVSSQSLASLVSLQRGSGPQTPSKPQPPPVAHEEPKH